MINGLVLSDPSFSAPVVPANADIADLLQVSAIGREITQAGIAAGKSDAEMLEEWRIRSLRLPHIASASVDVSRRTISFVSRIGLRQTNGLPERNPKQHPSLQAVAIANAHSIAEELRIGSLLFFTPNGGILGGPRKDYERAIERAKRGEPLSKDEARLLPEECRKLVRDPANPVPAE